LSYAGLAEELTPQQQQSFQRSSELLASLQKGQRDKMTFYTLLEESLQRNELRDAIIAHDQEFTEESRKDQHNRRIFEIKAIDLFIHRYKLPAVKCGRRTREQR